MRGSDDPVPRSLSGLSPVQFCLSHIDLESSDEVILLADQVVDLSLRVSLSLRHLCIGPFLVKAHHACDNAFRFFRNIAGHLVDGVVLHEEIAVPNSFDVHPFISFQPAFPGHSVFFRYAADCRDKNAVHILAVCPDAEAEIQLWLNFLISRVFLCVPIIRGRALIFRVCRFFRCIFRSRSRKDRVRIV